MKDGKAVFSQQSHERSASLELDKPSASTAYQPTRASLVQYTARQEASQGDSLFPGNSRESQQQPLLLSLATEMHNGSKLPGSVTQRIVGGYSTHRPGMTGATPRRSNFP